MTLSLSGAPSSRWRTRSRLPSGPPSTCGMMRSGLNERPLKMRKASSSSHWAVSTDRQPSALKVGHAEARRPQAAGQRQPTQEVPNVVAHARYLRAAGPHRVPARPALALNAFPSTSSSITSPPQPGRSKPQFLDTCGCDLAIGLGRAGHCRPACPHDQVASIVSYRLSELDEALSQLRVVLRLLEADLSKRGNDLDPRRLPSNRARHPPAPREADDSQRGGAECRSVSTRLQPYWSIHVSSLAREGCVFALSVGCTA